MPAVFPRDAAGSYAEAGFLAYSDVVHLPDLLDAIINTYVTSKISGSVMKTCTTSQWNLQQRDCSGLPPDSLLTSSHICMRICTNALQK